VTIRTDISIDWESSPRILTVLSPSTELTIQDLVDTCRWMENEIGAWDDPALIVAAGKDPLGGGVFVGITATLQNALVAFEARPGPTFELCRVFGGNLVAVDSVGAEVPTPFQSTAFVQVTYAASSSATLLDASGGLTQSQVRDAVWQASKASYTTPGTMGAEQNSISTAVQLAQTLLKYQKNRTRVDQTAYTLTIYDDDNLTPIKVFDLRNFAGLPSLTEVAERIPQ